MIANCDEEHTETLPILQRLEYCYLLPTWVVLTMIKGRPRSRWYGGWYQA
jgi:hypothetical protein